MSCIIWTFVLLDPSSHLTQDSLHLLAPFNFTDEAALEGADAGIQLKQ